MNVWKLTPLLVIALIVSACSSKTGETSATDTTTQPAPVEAAPAPAEPSDPAPAPPAPPAHVAAKPVEAKPRAETNKTSNNAAPAPVAPSDPAPAAPAPAIAAVKDDVPAPAPAPPPAPRKVEPVVIPSGTELSVILSDALNSGKNKAGDTFTASLAAPVYVDGKTILERGAKLEGTVVVVQGSGRVSGKANMSLALTGVVYKGKVTPITTRDLAAEAESSTGRDAKVVGGGAGLGALIGAIAGGKKGAAVGAAVGGAGGTGAVLATKGKEVDYPSEAKLTFVLDRELSLLP